MSFGYRMLGPKCEICAYNRASEAHHKRRRSQGGSDEPENLMQLCRTCHRLVHDFPAVSYNQGWLIRSGNV